MTLTERIARSVKARPGNVLLRTDFASMGSQSQISEALTRLQSKGVLMRIGTGLYAKTRLSSVTGSVIPAGSLETLSTEAMQRLGVDVSAGRAALEYNEGRTTQIPGAVVFNTGMKRIRRKIAIGGRRLVYENDLSRAAQSA